MKKYLFFLLFFLCPLFIFSQNVEVLGAIKIIDGTQGVDKILTSDADGLASWQLPPAPPIDSIYYQSVKICCNSWMTKNLDVDKYRNGDPIAHVTSSSAWKDLTTGAYCYYANDSTTYAAIYGKLYNWYAVNDSRGLAPEGWHVPTDFEWTTTVECLGGGSVAGGLMKEMGTAHWSSPNTDATNLSGFAGLPGGVRNGGTGSFNFINTHGFYWSFTELDETNARSRYLDNFNADVFVNSNDKAFGLSVRCLMD